MRIVQHIVLLQLREGTPAADLDALQVATEALVDQIPVALSVTFGPTFTTARADGFTHALIVRLPDKVRHPQRRPHPRASFCLLTAPARCHCPRATRPRVSANVAQTGLAPALCKPSRAHGAGGEAYLAHPGEDHRCGLRDGDGCGDGHTANEVDAGLGGGGRGGGDAACYRVGAPEPHESALRILSRSDANALDGPISIT